MLTVHIDGASRGNPGPAAAAAVIRRDGAVIKESSAVIGDMLTNNVAEYRALIGVLRYLPQVRHAGEPVSIYSDSKLVVEQANGRWACKEPRLEPLRDEARSLLAGASDVTLTWVPREQNSDADRLCNRALDNAHAQERIHSHDDR